MRLRPYLVTALVVAGIVAVFVLAEKKLRAGLGAEGPNGVAVEQADDTDGVRIVVIRSRFVDETARYRPDGALLSRDLKAILEDDADRIGTFRIALRGNQVIGTERYDFDKQARTRTWTHYGTDGDLLCTGSQDEDTGVEWWWGADGKVIPAKRARAIIDGDDAAYALDSPAAPAAMHNAADGVSVTNQPGNADIAGKRTLQAAQLFEETVLGPDNKPAGRTLGAILGNAKRPQRFFIDIDMRGGQQRVTGTQLNDEDPKRQRSVDRFYSPDGVLLYVRKTDEAAGKSSFFSPEGRLLKQAEVDDIVAANADENAIVVPALVRK